jgi:hypothetical protein
VDSFGVVTVSMKKKKFYYDFAENMEKLFGSSFLAAATFAFTLNEVSVKKCSALLRLTGNSF